MRRSWQVGSFVYLFICYKSLGIRICAGGSGYKHILYISTNIYRCHVSYPSSLVTDVQLTHFTQVHALSQYIIYCMSHSLAVLLSTTSADLFFYSINNIYSFNINWSEQYQGRAFIYHFKLIIYLVAPVFQVDRSNIDMIITAAIDKRLNR